MTVLITSRQKSALFHQLKKLGRDCEWRIGNLIYQHVIFFVGWIYQRSRWSKIISLCLLFIRSYWILNDSVFFLIHSETFFSMRTSELIKSGMLGFVYSYLPNVCLNDLYAICNWFLYGEHFIYYSFYYVKVYCL